MSIRRGGRGGDGGGPVGQCRFDEEDEEGMEEDPLDNVDSTIGARLELVFFPATCMPTENDSSAISYLDVHLANEGGVKRHCVQVKYRLGNQSYLYAACLACLRPAPQ